MKEVQRKNEREQEDSKIKFLENEIYKLKISLNNIQFNSLSLDTNLNNQDRLS